MEDNILDNDALLPSPSFHSILKIKEPNHTWIMKWNTNEGNLSLILSCGEDGCISCIIYQSGVSPKIKKDDWIFILNTLDIDSYQPRLVGIFIVEDIKKTSQYPSFFIQNKKAKGGFYYLILRLRQRINIIIPKDYIGYDQIIKIQTFVNIGDIFSSLNIPTF